ncbi:MAG: 50S ribosomal protein L6 [Sedimentisphaerales bacterium]|nr:50S ribosomal protein L6 [Sedimentisphaerales bacterium]
MSRIGKKPVEIPAGVKVDISGKKVKVTGPKGTLEMECHPKINVKLDESGKTVIVEKQSDQSRIERAMHGTTRALINNMVVGVSKGFEKKLEIYGTGYSVKEEGGNLVVNVGFSHPAKMPIPKSVKVQIDVPATKGNDIPAKFTLTGYNKQEIGQFATDVRKIRPPEPYQGKGIRFADEHVRRKVGKALAGAAG